MDEFVTAVRFDSKRVGVNRDYVESLTHELDRGAWHEQHLVNDSDGAWVVLYYRGQPGGKINRRRRVDDTARAAMRHELPIEHDKASRLFASVAASLTYGGTKFIMMRLDAKGQIIDFDPEHKYVKKIKKYVADRAE